MKLLMSSEITSVLGQQVHSLFKENCLTLLKDCPRSLESAWEVKIVKRTWINPSHNSWCHHFSEHSYLVDLVLCSDQSDPGPPSSPLTVHRGRDRHLIDLPEAI